MRQEWLGCSGRGQGPVGQAGGGQRQEGQQCRVNSLLRTESPDFETPLGTQSCLLESSALLVLHFAKSGLLKLLPFTIPVLLFLERHFQTSLVAQAVKHLPAMWETRVQSLGQEDLLEKEMATHSSILAWKIPWTEKPGRLQSMGSQRHD